MAQMPLDALASPSGTTASSPRGSQSPFAAVQSPFAVAQGPLADLQLAAVPSEVVESGGSSVEAGAAAPAAQMVGSFIVNPLVSVHTQQEHAPKMPATDSLTFPTKPARPS